MQSLCSVRSSWNKIESENTWNPGTFAHMDAAGHKGTLTAFCLCRQVTKDILT